MTLKKFTRRTVLTAYRNLFGWRRFLLWQYWTTKLNVF